MSKVYRTFFASVHWIVESDEIGDVLIRKTEIVQKIRQVRWVIVLVVELHNRLRKKAIRVNKVVGNKCAYLDVVCAATSDDSSNVQYFLDVIRIDGRGKLAH